MKIAFFGLKDFFDYFHISGFQSFVRRISLELVQSGSEVDYILYNAEELKEVSPVPNLKIKYFPGFKAAVQAMAASSYDHIVNIRLSRIDRMKMFFYLPFCLRNSRYHYMAFVWPDSAWKRRVIFYEAAMLSRLGRGKIICVSERLFRECSRISKNTYSILPPVPKNYFTDLVSKNNGDKIKLIFLGVLYADKGIDEAIEIFKALKDNPKFETLICAIHEPKNEKSVAIRDWLRSQDVIKYIEVNRYEYSPSVREMVGRMLKESDVLVQLYTTLGATVDTPLLLLEAMASLCAVITTPIGNIPDIYGSSRFLIDTSNGINKVLSFLETLSQEEVDRERKRIYEQNKKLQFEASKVASQFAMILGAKNV